MEPRELAVMRKQTSMFIKENPVDIVIQRGGTRTSDGAGGWVTSPGGAIPSQRVRLIPQQRGGALQSTNVDGERIQPEFVLIGEHDADVQTGDTFIMGGREYDITYVRIDHDYETWGEVVFRG